MRRWMCVLFLGILITGCQGDTTGSLQKATVVLDWTPNTNHTGLYVAREKGYFKEQGIRMEIVHLSGQDVIQTVAAQKADIGVSSQEGVTNARVQGIPVVSVAAIIQHNTSGFASLAHKNIQRPRDLVGKTYGSFGSPIEKSMVNWVMKQDNADGSKVNIIYTGNVDFFTAMKKKVDFMWIYYGWTGIESQLRGMPLHMMYLKEYSKDLDYYTPVLIASEKQIKGNQPRLRKIMDAISKGYQYAIHHPQEAAEILLKAQPDLNPALVKKSQQWLSPRYQADAPKWGYQQKEVWERYAAWLKKNQLLKGDFRAEDAFTNQLLPEGEG